MKIFKIMTLVALVCSGTSIMAMSEEDNTVQELTLEIEHNKQTLASLGHDDEESWSGNIIKKRIEADMPRLKEELRQAIEQAIAKKEAIIQSLEDGAKESWSGNITKKQTQNDIAVLREQLDNLE